MKHLRGRFRELRRIFCRKPAGDKEDETQQSVVRELPDNPYICCIREILEQILMQRELSYQTLYLALEDPAVGLPEKMDRRDRETHDGQMDEVELNVWLEADMEQERRARYAEECMEVADRDILDTLQQLSPGLNGLIILTDRPEYFTDYVEMMYEEYGLVVELQPRHLMVPRTVNVAIDFSYEGRSVSGSVQDGYLYLPIYRKPWKNAGNLDIMVPIGYNIVIVKRTVKNEQKEPLDKFEREFYA